MVVIGTAITGAAASDLSLTGAGMVDRIEVAAGWATPTAAQSVLALEWLNDGYRRMLRGEHLDARANEMRFYEWNMLKPIAQLSIGGATTGTATCTPAGTVTATTAIFDHSMVGQVMTVTDYDGAGTDLDVTITGYTSTTVVSVDDETNTWAAKAVSVAATGIYDLPALFGGILSVPVYQYGGDYLPKLEERSPEFIQQKWAANAALGTPEWYAIVPPTFSAALGQRWQCWIAPLAEEAMVWRYRYRLHQAPLADSATYPLGGPDFADLIVEAGKAEHEFAKNVFNGPHEQQYQRRIQVLISLDRTATSGGDAPEQLGDDDLGIGV